MTQFFGSYIINCLKAVPAVAISLSAIVAATKAGKVPCLNQAKTGWLVRVIACCAAAVVAGALAAGISFTLYDGAFHGPAALMCTLYVMFCIILLHYFPGTNNDGSMQGPSKVNSWIISALTLMVLLALGLYPVGMGTEANMWFLGLNALIAGIIECFFMYRLATGETFTDHPGNSAESWAQFLVLAGVTAAGYYYFLWLLEGYPAFEMTGV